MYKFEIQLPHSSYILALGARLSISFDSATLTHYCMPPRKNIVKSGNAGTSSKPSKEPPVQGQSDEPKPLFPPGSKTPLALLYERFIYSLIGAIMFKCCPQMSKKWVGKARYRNCMLANGFSHHQLIDVLVSAWESIYCGSGCA